MKLDLQYKSENEWTNCFESGPITLPSVSYLGFSAETGELSDNFDLISVETNNLYATTVEAGKPNIQSTKGSSKKARTSSKGSSGWGWTFVKVMLFFAVCGGGYATWTAYRTSTKRSSRFD